MKCGKGSLKRIIIVSIFLIIMYIVGIITWFEWMALFLLYDISDELLMIRKGLKDETNK